LDERHRKEFNLITHGPNYLPPVGGIEGQTFPVREAQTTCLRFDLTPTPHVVPGP
jgi:hypothetical protein